MAHKLVGVRPLCNRSLLLILAVHICLLQWQASSWSVRAQSLPVPTDKVAEPLLADTDSHEVKLVETELECPPTLQTTDGGQEFEKGERQAPDASSAIAPSPAPAEPSEDERKEATSESIADTDEVSKSACEDVDIKSLSSMALGKEGALPSKC